MGRAAVIATPRRAASLRDTAALRRPTPPGAVEARLALTEILIASDPGAECAEQTVQWLVESGGARQALCLGLDVDHKRLSPLATHGIPAVGAPVSLDVEDRSHPVVSVLFGRRPVTFQPRQDPGLISTPAFAVPLYGYDGREDVPVGVLLVSPPHSELVRDARWVADLLGHKLYRWHKLQTATDRSEEHTSELQSQSNLVC